MLVNVTWHSMTKLSDLFLYLLWLFILSLSTCCAESETRLVTKPLYLQDEFYFELVEPHEISYTYKIRPARDFGIPLNITIRNILLVPVHPAHACSPIVDTRLQLLLKHQIAFVERGQCSFLTKSINVEKVGARAIVIHDNDRENDGRMIDMIGDDTNRNTKIPAFFLLGKDGYMIRAKLAQMKMAGALINIPINATHLSDSRVKQPPWTLW